MHTSCNNHCVLLYYSPLLTWRDMQHLVVMSANPHNLHADDWVVNGVGRRVSHHFGYGIMNAGKMVELAKNWTNIPQQRVCEIVSTQRNQYVYRAFIFLVLGIPKIRSFALIITVYRT